MVSEAALGYAPRALLVAIVLACGWWPSGCTNAQDLSWSRLADGMAVAVWEPAGDCGGQVPPLVLVKVDPKRFRFETHHYRDEGLNAPPTIQEWQQRTQATLLFNAGLFDKDYSYLGLLIKDGRSLGSGPHPEWKGLFVAEPAAQGHRLARIVDLAKEPFSAHESVYREAAQSLMLLDESGAPRVRHSSKRARQTVVGEDQTGNILLIKTAAEVTMWELAVCLREGLPALRHAMAMDGGSSSDLLLSDGLPPSGQPGQAPRWRTLLASSTPIHIPLPAVIAVTPRTGAVAQQE